jgi:hypothetical protein
MRLIYFSLFSVLLVACQPGTSNNEDAQRHKADTAALKAPSQKTTLEERKLNGKIKSILRNTSENIQQDANKAWIVTDTAAHYEIENFDLNGYVTSQSNFRGPGIPLFAYKHTQVKDGSVVVAYINEEGKGYFSNTYTDDYTLVTAYHRLDGKDTVLLSRGTTRYEKGTDNYSVEQTEYNNDGTAAAAIHSYITRTTNGDTGYQQEVQQRATTADTSKLTIITLSTDRNGNPTQVLYLNPNDNRFKPYIYLYRYEYYPAK